jgi:hypothetical protein
MQRNDKQLSVTQQKWEILHLEGKKKPPLPRGGNSKNI